MSFQNLFEPTVVLVIGYIILSLTVGTYFTIRVVASRRVECNWLLRVLLIIAIWALSVVIRLPMQLYHYAHRLIHRLERQIKNWWRKRTYVPPQVVMIERDGIAVVASRVDYERCKKWHLDSVRDGRKLASEPFIVNPCYLFRHMSARITLEESHLFTGMFHYMDSLLEGCLPDEVTDMYVPFLSKSKKKRQEETKSFKYTCGAEAKHHLHGITWNGATVKIPRFPALTKPTT